MVGRNVAVADDGFAGGRDQIILEHIQDLRRAIAAAHAEDRLDIRILERPAQVLHAFFKRPLFRKDVPAHDRFKAPASEAFHHRLRLGLTGQGRGRYDGDPVSGRQEVLDGAPAVFCIAGDPDSGVGTLIYIFFTVIHGGGRCRRRGGQGLLLRRVDLYKAGTRFFKGSSLSLAFEFTLIILNQVLLVCTVLEHIPHGGRKLPVFICRQRRGINGSDIRRLFSGHGKRSVRSVCACRRQNDCKQNHSQ